MNRFIIKLLEIIFFIHFSAFCFANQQKPLTICCSEENDLFKVLTLNGVDVQRFDNPRLAISKAYGGVLILAESYPEKLTQIDSSVYSLAKQKGVRLFVEYPGSLPGIKTGPIRTVEIERAVIASDFFGKELDKMRILAINAKKFIAFEADDPHVVFARVAGFDKAVYGLPKETWPALFEHENGKILVCTSKLSNFLTARFAPKDAIEVLWERIFDWIMPGNEIPKLRWTEAVRPAYSKQETLSKNAEQEAFEYGISWYENSKLLISQEMNKKILDSVKNGTTGRFPPPSPDEEAGDGSYGIMQSYNSGIDLNGKQLRSAVRRGDNQCETAMTFAIAGKYLGENRYTKVAGNILDYYLFRSEARKGGRADPGHGAYGLIAWGVDDPAWLKANYGDDNARQMMGIMAAGSVTGEDRWDEALALCMLANIRTTARTGFRADRLDMGPLNDNGWLHYFNANTIRMSPHFEAYLWASFLWAYEQTGDELLYERTIRAIRKTMQNYPDGWSWTNGLAQEKARMLLPLAWLVRVKDTPEHRGWLRQVGEGLIALQDECGAIREELGKPGMGAYPPPKSNDAYGGNEASLIQKNGDPVADMLYTTNFAFLGLHEAAAATGDALFKDAEDKLAEFLCRIQVRSEIHPEFNGAWFRGFDFQRWQYWASDADAGWGAWCAITGWTHPWITSVIAMRQKNTSFWEMTSGHSFVDDYKRLRPKMIPEDVISSSRERSKVKKSLADINIIIPPDHRYSGINDQFTLIDGDLAGTVHNSGDWLGFEGKDFEAVVDLGKITSVRKIKIQFLHSQAWGIFLPENVEFSFSSDGKNFSSSVKAGHQVPETLTEPLVEIIGIESVEMKCRFIRIMAKSKGRIPQWHKAKGLDSWLFVGEIMVNRSNEKKSPVVPLPAKVEGGEGKFILDANTRVLFDKRNIPTAKYLSDVLSRGTGYSIEQSPVNSAGIQENCIILKIDEDLKSLGDEGYRLEVENRSVSIISSTATGVFYGCQTLLQLLPVEIFSTPKKKNVEWLIDSVEIEDQPRFEWRGLLIDCARHFYNVDVLKRQIDLAALYKINRLHLHLTDDQGWRVEIDRYPLLTKIGSWRKEKGFGAKGSDNVKPYGGFFTKRQLRGIVEYAKSRHITVVPEIEMPGHMVGAMTAYPQYSCTGGPHELWTTSGISKEVLCLGNDEAIEFVKNILDEVIEIFPSEYIHIGGDEAPRDRWKTCPKCQDRIKKLGLQNEDELQSWFTSEISRYLALKGRRMVGWSEILHGMGDGLDKGAIVHSWLSPKYAVDAIKKGHDVIMSSHTHCYLDYPYNRISLSKAYEFDPIPSGIGAEESSHVLGIQGNMWTEWIPTEQRLDYQIYPRLCAYAETGWTGKYNKSLVSFLERMDRQYRILDNLGVYYYRIPEDPGKWGKTIGEWKADQVSSNPVVLKYNITKEIDSSGIYEIMALYTYGAHAAIIEWVALYEDGNEISRDTHEAWSGYEKRNIFYKLKLDKLKPGADYELSMRIFVPDNGSDSNGIINIKKIAD